MNILADIRAQPTTPQAGLVPTPRCRPTPPGRRRRSPPPPPARRSVAPRTTRSPAPPPTPAARVGSVEVSTDNGATWHLAEGRESWTYSWRPNGIGSVTIRARATDDSANISTTAVGYRPADVPVLAARRHQPARPGAEHRRCRDQRGPEVPQRHRRVHLRRAVLQGGRQHPHRHRVAVVLERRAPRHRFVHQRDDHRLAVAHLHQPGGRQRRHHLRGVVLRAERPLHRLDRRADQRHRQAAAARPVGCLERRQRRLPLRQRRVPQRGLGRGELLGRPRVPEHRGQRHDATDRAAPHHGRGHRRLGQGQAPGEVQ